MDHGEAEASSSETGGGLGRSRALPEGAHFANYVIGGLLGSGGLARIYRARHQTLGHEVALKVFEPAVAPGPSGLARFLREAHQAASIRHPHVVQTLDAGSHEGLPYLVMELLEGRDLESYLRIKHQLEELELIELAMPIVAALMALHAQDLVHGDLGPGNIFLVQAAQGQATSKLLDIGISKPHRHLRLTAAARQRLMGSPLYLAPEGLRGRPLTPASDQYSLGLILYECITGVNPFLATSLKESVRLIISGQRLAVLEQCATPSPGLASIIERALSLAPEERFPDLASLGRALLQLADQRTRATWEFSFQSEPSLAGAGAARGTAAARSRAPSRWAAPAVALAVLGWTTAGVVSFVLPRQDDVEQSYVMLGPGPTTAAPQQRLYALRAPTNSEAPAAPCPDVGASGVGLNEASAGGSAAAADPAAEPSSEAPVVEEELVAAPQAPEVPGAAGAAALPDMTLDQLLLEPPLGNEQAVPAMPEGPTAGQSGAPLPPRGTNNAPIFD